MDVRFEIEQATSHSVDKLIPLGGGSVGQVYELRTQDGSRLVVKHDSSNDPCLDIEGFMLDFLRTRSNLPVPRSVYSSPRLLIMTHVPGSSSFTRSAQEHAAELLAELHDLKADRFGFHRPTLIGGLHQPNPWTESWISFFAEQRLDYMAVQAYQSGRLPLAVVGRLEKLAGDLPEWLEEPEAPAMIHGDVWTTNVLSESGKITGFLDPAIYYAAPEIELAFITLFNTFGQPFFERYHELRPIAPGFFEVRRHIYNLYPLLVHVRLFGGAYITQVGDILSRFGY